ncbi:MAG: hypothetical protein P1V18_04930 [Candidatus Gracilibacteria bacterium]|nr:hypothetical protein [Candidatus Gracilibacteria bacterium]
MINGKNSDLFERFISGLILSTCLNSLTLYILAEGFEMPINRTNVIIMSLSISIIILAVSQIQKARKTIPRGK